MYIKSCAYVCLFGTIYISINQAVVDLLKKSNKYVIRKYLSQKHICMLSRARYVISSGNVRDAMYI